MHGREARIPFEAEQAALITGPDQLTSIEERVEKLQQVRDKSTPLQRPTLIPARRNKRSNINDERESNLTNSKLVI